MIQHKIKLSIIKGTELLWFLEGIKITHSDPGSETLAEQLFLIEKTINNQGELRCHISCDSQEIDEIKSGV